MVPSPDQGQSGPAARPRAHALRQAEAWVFDLDNTLYPPSTNLFAQIDERMRAFIAGFLDLDLDEARRVQKTYFREYGTTLRGLMNRHGLEPGLFLEYVHAVDLDPVPPNPALAAALARLPGRKYIFTNASAAHAGRITDRLGVTRHFDAVFDIADAEYVPKPEPRIYDTLVQCHGLDPGKTVMIEDIARNLAPAAALGMTTVWLRNDSPVGVEGADGDHVHHVIDDLVPWLEDVVADGTLS
ncbi:MAG: pyrimidine 5'-nucleotidase [Proteobacteria bacterium]|nr:pyrimidine 5'-nucleotidase [Pseudomonadota bacterium]